MNADEQYNVVSLFSGCGGLDTGLINSGKEVTEVNPEDSQFEIVWSNDKMEHASKTLSDNFDKDRVTETEKAHDSDVVYNGDVRNVSFEKIPVGDVSLVVGGFPCQDFSVLQGDDGRNGIKVERGKLYMEFARSLASIQPKMFIAENVKGLLSANEGKAYETIIDDFKNLGDNWTDIKQEYETSGRGVPEIDDKAALKGYSMLHSEVVDFSKLGVPQGRERLVMIGLRSDLVPSIEQKASLDIHREGIQRKLASRPPFNDYPLTTIEAFKGDELSQFRKEYAGLMRSFEEYIEEISSDRASKYKENVESEYTLEIWSDYEWRNNVDSSYEEKHVLEAHRSVLEELGYLRQDLRECSYDDESNEEMREQDRVLERLRHIPPGENYEFVEDTEHHVTGLMSNTYKRVHPLEPSPTVVASGGGGTWGYHYLRERGKLTNRERARIQSFPDDFLFSGTNAEVRKQIGNAVPPLGAKRIGEAIIPVLELV